MTRGRLAGEVKKWLGTDVWSGKAGHDLASTRERKERAEWGEARSRNSFCCGPEAWGGGNILK